MPSISPPSAPVSRGGFGGGAGAGGRSGGRGKKGKGGKSGGGNRNGNNNNTISKILDRQDAIKLLYADKKAMEEVYEKKLHEAQAISDEAQRLAVLNALAEKKAAEQGASLAELEQQLEALRVELEEATALVGDTYLDNLDKDGIIESLREENELLIEEEKAREEVDKYIYENRLVFGVPVKMINLMLMLLVAGLFCVIGFIVLGVVLDRFPYLFDYSRSNVVFTQIVASGKFYPIKYRETTVTSSAITPVGKTMSLSLWVNSMEALKRPKLLVSGVTFDDKEAVPSFNDLLQKYPGAEGFKKSLATALKCCSVKAAQGEKDQIAKLTSSLGLAPSELVTTECTAALADPSVLEFMSALPSEYEKIVEIYDGLYSGEITFDVVGLFEKYSKKKDVVEDLKTALSSFVLDANVDQASVDQATQLASLLSLELLQTSPQSETTRTAMKNDDVKEFVSSLPSEYRELKATYSNLRSTMPPITLATAFQGYLRVSSSSTALSTALLYCKSTVASNSSIAAQIDSLIMLISPPAAENITDDVRTNAMANRHVRAFMSELSSDYKDLVDHYTARYGVTVVTSNTPQTAALQGGSSYSGLNSGSNTGTLDFVGLPKAWAGLPFNRTANLIYFRTSKSISANYVAMPVDNSSFTYQSVAKVLTTSRSLDKSSVKLYTKVEKKTAKIAALNDIANPVPTKETVDNSVDPDKDTTYTSCIARTDARNAINMKLTHLPVGEGITSALITEYLTKVVPHMSLTTVTKLWLKTDDEWLTVAVDSFRLSDADKENIKTTLVDPLKTARTLHGAPLFFGPVLHMLSSMATSDGSFDALIKTLSKLVDGSRDVGSNDATDAAILKFFKNTVGGINNLVQRAAYLDTTTYGLLGRNKEDTFTKLSTFLNSCVTDVVTSLSTRCTPVNGVKPPDCPDKLTAVKRLCLALVLTYGIRQIFIHLLIYPASEKHRLFDFHRRTFSLKVGTEQTDDSSSTWVECRLTRWLVDDCSNWCSIAISKADPVEVGLITWAHMNCGNVKAPCVETLLPYLRDTDIRTDYLNVYNGNRLSSDKMSAPVKAGNTNIPGAVRYFVTYFEGTINATVVDPAGYFVTVSSSKRKSKPLKLSAWHHVVMVLTEKDLNLMVDNVLVDVAPLPPSFNFKSDSRVVRVGGLVKGYADTVARVTDKQTTNTQTSADTPDAVATLATDLATLDIKPKTFVRDISVTHHALTKSHIDRMYKGGVGAGLYGVTGGNIGPLGTK